MKLTNLITALLFPLIAAAYSPFKGAIRAPPAIEGKPLFLNSDL
jgi:hypothetical protein